LKIFNPYAQYPGKVAEGLIYALEEVFDAKKLYRCRCDKSIQYYFSHVSGDPVSVVTMTWIPAFAGTRKPK